MVCKLQMTESHFMIEDIKQHLLVLYFCTDGTILLSLYSLLRPKTDKIATKTACKLNVNERKLHSVDGTSIKSFASKILLSMDMMTNHCLESVLGHTVSLFLHQYHLILLTPHHGLAEYSPAATMSELLRMHTALS